MFGHCAVLCLYLRILSGGPGALDPPNLVGEILHEQHIAYNSGLDPPILVGEILQAPRDGALDPPNLVGEILQGTFWAHNSSFSPAGCAPSSAPGPSPSRAGGSHFVPAVSTNAHNPFLLPTGPAARPNGGEATPLRPNPSNTPSAPRHSSRRAGVGSAVFVRAAQANAHNPFLHANGDVTNCGPQMRRPACSANLAPGRDCRTDG